MTKSSSTPPRVKPAKPHKDFPLVAHPNGQWSKQVRGKVYYFGPWEDPDGALARYLEVKDDIHAGREPKPKTDELTVRDLCNTYLEHCEWKFQRGKITRRTFNDEKGYCVTIVQAIGDSVAGEIGARDFQKLHRSYPTTWGPTRESHHVKATKRVFKWAFDNEYIDRPPRYGSFQPPSVAKIRSSTQRRSFTPEELRRILAHLQGPRYAQQLPMVLLGINGGFAPGEVARLKDWEIGEYIDTTRPKTNIRRLVPLWPETCDTIAQWQRVRKAPHPEGYLFATKRGNPWFQDGVRKSPVTQSFGRVLRELEIPGSFNCLRHTFQSVCDDEGIPRHITKAVMGHVNPDISTNYSHAKMLGPITEAVNAVHDWLYREGGAV